jgi:hypothetical protein
MGKKLIIKNADFSENALTRDPFYLDVEDYTLYEGVIQSSNNMWKVNEEGSSSQWYHIRIPIEDLEGANKITVNTTPDKTTPRFGFNINQAPGTLPSFMTIGFFSSALPTPVIDGSYPENLIRIDRPSVNIIETLTVPTNTEYIYVYIGYYNGNNITSYIPSMLEAVYE